MNNLIDNPGATHSQVLILSQRIKHLTAHLQQNKKDYSAKKGLLSLVGLRNRLLKYLRRKDLHLYRETHQKMA